MDPIQYCDWNEVVVHNAHLQTLANHNWRFQWGCVEVLVQREKGDGHVEREKKAMGRWLAPPCPGQEKVQEQEQEQDSCFPARVGRSTHRVLPRLAKLTKHLGPCRAGTTTTQGHC
jgi:hypothetical protein